MAMTESKLRQIIKEEASRLLSEAPVQRAGGGERAPTGANLDFLIALVYAFPGQLRSGDLRAALKNYRGIDPTDPQNRGYYSTMFAQMDRLPRYVDFSGPGRTATLNAAGEERLDMQFYPESTPSPEELQEELEQYLR